jgi:ABC-type nitrate/sulfonate/bicarbonate transport system substrate-binding protein
VADRLVLGAFTPSVLLSVARRTGRLAGQGLEVEEVPVGSSPAQFRSLLDGELDVAFTSPDNVLAYRFDPTNPLRTLADVRIVATVDRGLGLALYGRPGLDPTALSGQGRVPQPGREGGPGIRARSGKAEVRERSGLRRAPTTQPVGMRGRERRGRVAGHGLVLGVDVATSGFAVAMYDLLDTLGVDRDGVEVVALGSTPRRLQALREGGCDATMLNAGNDLVAEDAGCRPLARVADTCSPYVGTVVCLHGEEHLTAAHRLSRALRLTADDICGGRAREVAAEEAAERLGLSPDLAVRYVDRLADPAEGLIPDPEPDLRGLRTVVELRRRHLPAVVDGVDVLAAALEPSSGLVAAAATRP